jgi:hypothetical protein
VRKPCRAPGMTGSDAFGRRSAPTTLLKPVRHAPECDTPPNLADRRRCGRIRTHQKTPGQRSLKGEPHSARRERNWTRPRQTARSRSVNPLQSAAAAVAVDVAVSTISYLPVPSILPSNNRGSETRRQYEKASRQRFTSQPVQFAKRRIG